MNTTNIVEVDGVCFETLMPERLIAIPPIKSYSYVSLQLGIRITNNTSVRLRFVFHNGFCLIPNILDSNDQIVFRGYYCERSVAPISSDFLLVMPGEDLIFYPQVFLYWQQNPKKKRSQKLNFSVSFQESDGWAFNVNPGVYQVQFTYQQTSSSLKHYYDFYSYSIPPSIFKECWVGEVTTPLVDFCLL